VDNCGSTDTKTFYTPNGPSTSTYTSGGCVPATFNYNLITTSGSSVTSRVTLPSEISYIEPDLQAQDGTFFGLVDYSYGPYDDFLAKFDNKGNIKWSVPGYYPPSIATSDGGVIAESYLTGQTTTFDQNGNSTGQLASLPTQSFTGSTYKLGPIDEIAVVPYDYASSHAATTGGNPGANGTYVPTLGAIYRAQIASDARSYIGNSTKWNEKTNGGVTCNLFVRDVLTQASNECQLNIAAPVRPNLSWWQSNWRHPFLAKDWANPNIDGGCWKPLAAGPGGALPGDVIATGYPPNGPDTTGHVGIVVEPDSGYPNYIDASAADVAPYWWTGQQKQSFIAGTITLTDYGFRQLGFDFTNPQDYQGLERDSNVRRFACY
jgi:hypothetical protein